MLMEDFSGIIWCKIFLLGIYSLLVDVLHVCLCIFCTYVCMYVYLLWWNFIRISGECVGLRKIIEDSEFFLTFCECLMLQINASPYENGWIIKVEMSDKDEINKLMDSDQYSKFCQEEDAKH